MKDDHQSPRAPVADTPERQKAAQYARAAQFFKISTFVLFGVLTLCAFLVKGAIYTVLLSLLLILSIASALLYRYCGREELRIRCTKRTTACCVDTVRRHSGRHATRHPIVAYEVEGVTHTAELPVSCSRHAEGELYTIYYDPSDPSVVRTPKRGLFK